MGSVDEVMEGRDSDNISVSVISQREEVDGLNIPELSCGNLMAYNELSKSSSQLPSSTYLDAQEELKLARKNSFPLSISSLEGKQIRRRSGKMASSSSGYSKKSRMGQMEGLSMNEVEPSDVKDKSQMAKTKNGLNGKRVDRRNGKVSMKSKYDLFSLKSGIVTFNSGGLGNNSLGVCGLKQDAYDITKHMAEVTVKELLDDHSRGPKLTKEKGKQPANGNDNILNSVKKACSILQRKKPIKIQSCAETDDSNNWNVSTAEMNVDASNNGNKKLDSITELSSYCKGPPKVLDFLVCRPKDILQRVGLPPPVDLDALLLDAAKPVYIKDSLDSRGKPISQRASVAIADAIKFSTNRSSCNGKWARIDNTAALFQGRSDFVAELECLNYDPNLVPVKSIKYLPLDNHPAPCVSVSFPGGDFSSSSSATCTRESRFSPEFGGNSKCEEDDAGDSPRALVAAQTLCNIRQFPRQEKHQRMTWTSKSLDKTIKACKSKPENRFGEIFTKPEPVVSNGLVKRNETSSISKKPRLLLIEKGKDVNTRAKGLVNWSIPRSSTQSSSKSYRDSPTNVKSYNNFMMPPPSSRVFDKASNSRQKLR